MLSIVPETPRDLLRTNEVSVSPPFELKDFDSVVALLVAESTPLTKQPGEKDTEFVKRIVCAYMNALFLVRTEEKH
jgi:hypothetical protein